MGLHKDDYQRSCIQELLAPFLIDHIKELKEVNVEETCVSVKDYIETLLEGVGADFMFCKVYKELVFQKKDNHDVLDIPKLLKYILGQNEDLKEKFLKSLWEKYEGVLKEYDPLKWWKNDQAWQDLEEYLLEQKESAESISGVREMVEKECLSSEEAFLMSRILRSLKDRTVDVMKGRCFLSKVWD